MNYFKYNDSEVKYKNREDCYGSVDEDEDENLDAFSESGGDDDENKDSS